MTIPAAPQNLRIPAAGSDIVQPGISTVVATPSTTSCTITWTTNEPSSSQVIYGTSTAYGSTSALDSNLVTNHSVTISGLTSGTPHNFRVRSRDAAGNLAVGENGSFTTSSAGMELISSHSWIPIISITGPALQSLGWYDFMRLGWDGELYVVRDHNTGGDGRIGLSIIKNGIVTPILVNGRRGDRPTGTSTCIASMALLDPAPPDPNYSAPPQIAVDNTNQIIYSCDGYNGKIRWLKKVAGVWTVGTLVSGIGKTIAITVDSSGYIWTISGSSLIKINPSTGTYEAKVIDANVLPACVDMAIDSTGIIYGISRGQPLCLWRYVSGSAIDQMSDIGALADRVWNGPVQKVLLHEPLTIAVTPDGTTAYIGAGDIYNILRVKDLHDWTADLSNTLCRVSTLQPNYTWTEVGTTPATYWDPADGSLGWMIGSVRDIDSFGYCYIGYNYHLYYPIRRVVLP